MASVLLTACVQTAPVKPAAETTIQPAAPPSSTPSPVVASPPREITPLAAVALHTMAAVDWLEAGNEDQASNELKQALTLDASNKLALSLKRQIAEDPVARFGRESFNYTVKNGETLSQIATRFLGDAFLFPALAKYNGIKVPKQVGEGLILKIPGRTPGKVSESNKGTTAAAGQPKNEAINTAPANKSFQTAQVSEKSGNLTKALNDYKLATAAGHPDAPAKVEAISQKLSDLHSRAARSALARQNLDAAIQEWDQVLQLKPNDETAQLERQKVLRLKDAFQKK